AREALVSRLDATAGLERVTENAAGIVWRVSTDPDRPATADSVARARVLDIEGGWLADVPAGPVSVTAEVDAGPEGRILTLAERADAGWRAWADGAPLPSMTVGWRQGFELPADGGTVTVRYAPSWLRPWNVAQAVVLGLTALLALPLRRRRTEVV
ncbi:glycosyltransferase family 2 protein, partial [Georgenia sp. 10Sc9-8]|nr:glycosyltransferase family 2 protein [Georgenia halotolerans]